MTDHGIRSGSLQFYPRVRARKVLPSANWKVVSKEGAGLLGFVGYKVGMTSAYVTDNTDDSMTQGRKVVVPATIIECPALRIYSVRFYKNGKVAKDFVVDFDAKSLGKRVKKINDVKKVDEISVEDYDDVRVIVYSKVKDAGFSKKRADIIELAISGGNVEEKFNFVKENVGKDIMVSDVLSDRNGGGIIDIHGVTKGFGNQGPVKRFGIRLKDHKSEKGVRRPGSLAPWHPARTTFRAPMAGQTGYHSRVAYNVPVISIGKISEKDINKKSGFHKYGKIRTEYMVVAGSVQGAKKRPLLFTYSIRPTKKQVKKKYDLVELR